MLFLKKFCEFGASDGGAFFFLMGSVIKCPVSKFGDVAFCSMPIERLGTVGSDKKFLLLIVFWFWNNLEVPYLCVCRRFGIVYAEEGMPFGDSLGIVC